MSTTFLSRMGFSWDARKFFPVLHYVPVRPLFPSIWGISAALNIGLTVRNGFSTREDMPESEAGGVGSMAVNTDMRDRTEVIS